MLQKNSVYIKGKRHEDRKEVGDNYVNPRIVIGRSFSRSQPLPVAVLADKARRVYKQKRCFDDSHTKSSEEQRKNDKGKDLNNF